MRTYKFWAALGALILSVTLGLGTRLETAQAQTPTDEPGNDQETLSGVTLQALGVEEAQEIELNNTSPVREINFYLPPGWTPIEGSTLDLSARYVTTGASDANPGVLEVWLNNTLAGAVNLENLGSTVSQVSVPIPEQLLSAPDASGMHTLRFRLATGQNCDRSTAVFIGTSSTLNIAHELNPTPEFSFASYPRLFAPNSLEPARVLFILPVNPTAEHLATAGAIAARLGRLGTNPAMIYSTTDAAFDPGAEANSHLIVVGAPATNTILPEVAGGHEDEVEPGVGMLHMQASPWNPQRVVIVVTGGDEAGVSLAGGALASPASASALGGTHTVVTEIPGNNQPAPRPSSGTLESLGYPDVTRSGTTETEIMYEFDLEQGYTIEPGGVIELHFAHASPLGSGSSITLMVNDDRVGSAELNERNSQDGSYRFALSNNLTMWRGNNVIRLLVQMNPSGGDEGTCASSFVDEDWPWITIYNSSTINFVASGGSRPEVDLSKFPRPFEESAGLTNTVFVLPESPELGTIDAFVKIAARLGSETREAFFSPQVQLSNTRDLPGNATVIAIGRPSINGYIASLNANMPQPFEEGTDRISMEDNPASFALPDNYGVIQLVSWETGATHTTLVVTGTDDQSIRMAAEALASGRPEISGDLIFVMADRIAAFDTNLSGSSPLLPTESVIGSTPRPSVENPVDANPQIWAIPIVIAAASALLGLILIVAYLRNRRSIARTRRS